MQSGWLRRSVAAREPRNKRITFHFKDDAGRDIQNERGGIQTGFPTLYDIRLGRLLSYMRHRHYRDFGSFSPI